MPKHADPEQLRNIKTLPQLIRYLRDELDWPIDQDEAEDVATFEYSLEEIGLSKDYEGIIKEIKQLRPLDSKQPWGIFWVNFEKKKLPVVILRRILGNLVFKKRAKGSKSQQAAWHAHDLMFISAYGEDSDRAVTFAHFSQDPENPKDLPVLKVLGWDDGDTIPHLADAHQTLKDNLRWPTDVSDHETWRKKWSSAFVLKHREVISTTEELVEELAALATSIRRRAETAMRRESQKGPLRSLHAAFKEALIHDLKEEDFADVIAQTISYGLLTARFTHVESISVQKLVEMVPPTNPFLRELLGTFLHLAGRRSIFDFDELGIQDVVDLLNRANVDAIKRDFGNKTQGEDPIIHFYEHFLSAYDKKMKIKRGVFYTPQPVVSYIVRSVHETLQQEFGLEDGLASTATWGEIVKRNPGLKVPEAVTTQTHFVQILDPATGTGTFLVEAIEVIYQTLLAKWKKIGLSEKEQEKAWNQYVPEHLLPRLHGYELMMAPYAIAHMKIGLKLADTGYKFLTDERARIYLTNSLEPAMDFSGRFAFDIPALAHEAQAVNAIKRHQLFTVVIGNPPYSGNSSNTGEWVSKLVRDYYFVDGVPLGERNPKWLQDDYVKFIRVAQAILNQSPLGVLGFITNHSYADNPTFRGMRRSLMSTFHKVRFFDLHGNSKKKEISPDGRPDENVFDIQQGVAIILANRLLKKGLSSSVFHSDLWGSRAEKYALLARTTIGVTKCTRLEPTAPFYLFVPQDTALRAEFELYNSVIDIFQLNTMGITTGRDQLCVSYSAKEAKLKLEEFVSKLPEHDLADRYGLSNKSGWNIANARKAIRSRGVSQLYCRPIAYRPFDVRILYLDSAIVGRSRLEVMENMKKDGKNIGLCSTRQVNGDFRHVFCANALVNDCLVSLESGERTYLFPLWIFPTEKQPADLLGEMTPKLNFNSKFLLAMAQKLNLTQFGIHGLPKGLTPEDVFHYAYAVFHSPAYRSLYSEFLKIEFPRLPLTGKLELFRALAQLGNQLVAMHLLESSKFDKVITEVIGGRNLEVEKISWSKNTVWLDKAQTIGFKDVREDVWNFQIGGYQVCEKWLKDRKGRKLTKDDIDHYQQIVAALSETIRLMAEIDKVIDKYGGWPGAFSTRESKEKIHNKASSVGMLK